MVECLPSMRKSSTSNSLRGGEVWVEIEKRKGKRDRKKERGGEEKTDSCTSSSDLYTSKMVQAWPHTKYIDTI